MTKEAYGLKARFQQIADQVASWNLSFISSTLVNDYGLLIKFSKGSFSQGAISIRYVPAQGGNSWTPVIVPSLFYGAELRAEEKGRVFLIGSGLHAKNLPDGVFCWKKDEDFVSALFNYAPLNQSIKFIPPLAVMPDIHQENWIEVRPLPKSEATPIQLIWFISALNMAWSVASGQAGSEYIFPLGELKSSKRTNLP